MFKKLLERTNAKFGSLNWDRIGIALSGICMVHCLALPVAVAAMPVLTMGLGHSHLFHALILILVVPTVLLALRRAHRQGLVMTLLGIGLLLIIAGLSSGSFWHNFTLETILTVAGSIFLVGGHITNYLTHSKCQTHHSFS